VGSGTQHLAERIILSHGALEGERKQVTVLFADPKSSMELLADRDPEEARAILISKAPGLRDQTATTRALGRAFS
jgi:hypothetical protein